MMSGTPADDARERSDRPLAAYFDSLPRESAERGWFTPDEVADIIRRDRDAATR
jgi:hypothetical protein